MDDANTSYTPARTIAVEIVAFDPRRKHMAFHGALKPALLPVLRPLPSRSTPTRACGAPHPTTAAQ
eukprot:6191102-Pleurochrysis_carterae.AAC.1